MPSPLPSGLPSDPDLKSPKRMSLGLDDRYSHHRPEYRQSSYDHPSGTSSSDPHRRFFDIQPTSPNKRPRLASPSGLFTTFNSRPDVRPLAPRPEGTGPAKELGHGNSGAASSSANTKTGNNDNNSATTMKRAAQACLRCRKQKLRCLGGQPCERCKKANTACEYGKTTQATAGASSSASRLSDGHKAGEDEKPFDLHIRRELEASGDGLGRLESSVATLLAGLAGGPPRPGGGYLSGEALHRLGSGSAQTLPSRRRSPPFGAPQLPPPTHSRTIDPPRIGVNSIYSISPDLSGRFSTSPGVTRQSHISPHASSGVGQTPEEARRAEDPETKIAQAKESLYEAPFKDLLYATANKDQTALSSRRNSMDGGRKKIYDNKLGGERDDPVKAGIIDSDMAETLFHFFIDHCHPFLPVVNVALEDAFTSIRQSPPLISAMIAIAARFYIRYTTRMPGRHRYPTMEPEVPHRLANLAETHLAQTLLRKQYALSDVQAIILLAAWGLRPGGKGPDAWIVTGHAARIARRLGVHKVLAQAAETARATEPESEEWQKLEAFLPQWRTWLCWFGFDGFLSLGFGRPQSTQFETVDETGFLQIRLNQPVLRPRSTSSVSLYGDVYIASQVQLAQIGRDLINWGEMMADPEKAIYADPRRAALFQDTDLSMPNMLKELNTRLDDWFSEWVYAGGPYALYLGVSARIARLQAEHMRLCLNSYALGSGADEDPFIAQCLKKALAAATNTIQTHSDAARTDLALSFATDYLTITLAQAAIFLVRISKAPAPIQAVLNTETSVLAHYIRMSIELLELSDLSETRLASYLARTIREIARAAGLITVPGSAANITPPQTANPSRDPSHSVSQSKFREGSDIDATNVSEAFLQPREGSTLGGPSLSSENTELPSNPVDGFDFESYLQMEGQLDLGYLLGLPGDGMGGMGGMTSGAGEQGKFGSSAAGGFGMNGTLGFGMEEFGGGSGTGDFGWSGLFD